MDNKDLLNEVSDFDQDIKKRQQLIEEAKKIPADASWSEAKSVVESLQKKWKRIGQMESAYEDGLKEEFESIIDSFYAKRKDELASVVKVKEDLIAQAQKLAQEADLNKVTKQMNELMDSWKQAGTTNKQQDDELWAKFNEARQTFFDKKHENWQAMQEKMNSAKEIKEGIVNQAKELANSDHWKATAEKFKELMDSWKAAGYAGKKVDDALWEEFNAARQAFYDARNNHYDKLREEYSAKVEAKKALIEEAKALTATNSFDKETTEKVKALNTKWKEIGYSGKENEDDLWKEFRTVADEYFAGLKALYEKKHQDWLDRMTSAKDRKADLIEKQKRQLKWMEQEANAILSQSAADEMAKDIEDKKAFIAQLETELQELEEKIKE